MTALARAYMLIVADQEELADIRIWLEEHPDVSDMREANIDPALKPRLDKLLGWIQDSCEACPCYVPIPHDLAELLQWVIDDWVEVVSTHNEEFETDLVSVEG